jgi:N-acetylglucosamine-6-phosphate deacetylase
MKKGGEFKLLQNLDIYTPRRHIRNGVILIKDGKIAHVGPGGLFPEMRPDSQGKKKPSDQKEDKVPISSPAHREYTSPPGFQIFDFKGNIAVPGFIDIHLHGGGGADFMDAAPQAVIRAWRTHLEKGTTSVLPTLMTASSEDILSAMEAIRIGQKPGGPMPEILGLNLEGPYISMEKRGAQPAEHIRDFKTAELVFFVKASGRTIKILTLAPERPGAVSLIRRLKSLDIIPAAGHSNATFGQAVRAIRAGIRHGTHLFNAMSGLFHRDPGLAGALLFDDGVTVELIADGVHVHPAMVSLVLAIKPPEKIILVSDATRETGLQSNPSKTRDGRLYGSSITLDRAIKNLTVWTGRSLSDILPMATSNPARLLGLYPRKGCLKKGADADIVILERGLKIKTVFARGEQVSFARERKTWR